MYQNILVPISPDEPAASAKAVDFARSILGDGGRLTVLTVLEVPPAYVADYLPETQADKVISEQEERLRSELERHSGIASKVVLGHAARTILDEAENLDCDCIVIASHRPGPRHFFLGSTASRVVRRALCSVHVMR